MKRTIIALGAVLAWVCGVYGATHEGVLYYRVYRGTRTGEAYAVEIDTTTATSYADESGAAGKTYYYSVKAVGASTESGFSAFVGGSR